MENGLEACNIAKAREYDIILMDCNMPIMDGWQVGIMFYQPVLYTCKTLQNPLMQRANVRVWLEVY